MKRATKHALADALLDPAEPTSVRQDALDCLAYRLAKEKVALDRCARMTCGRDRASALAAAARLAIARDRRGLTVLTRAMGSRDEGLAASAALSLVREFRDRTALDGLARLARGQDVRFQLAAGYALQCAGDRRASRFAFTKLPGCRLRTDRVGTLKTFATADGYDIANSWCAGSFFGMPHDTAFSAYYVMWVHTCKRWRRRGLARIAMEGSFREPLAKECAIQSLHTGTRFVAHTLYRQFGFADYNCSHTFEKALAAGSSARPPGGVNIRPAMYTDAAAMHRLLAYVRDELPIERMRFPVPGAWGPAFVAYEGRRPVGAVMARLGHKEARMEFLCVAADKTKKKDDQKKKPVVTRRERIGLALLARLHAGLRRQGQEQIIYQTWRPMLDDFHAWLLRRAGYGSKKGDFVELHRIGSLPQFLREIAPALKKRLAGSQKWRHWSGSVSLVGSRLRGRIDVSGGTVTAHELDGRGAAVERGIVLHGNDESIQRIALGIASPFEEHLQARAQTVPTFNPEVSELLETLFPRAVRGHT